MNDERIGFNSSIAGYQYQWEKLVDTKPYDPAAYRGYVALVEFSLTILIEGSRVLDNPAWASAIANFRAAHSDNLRRLFADLYRLRERLPERGDYDTFKRAALHLPFEPTRVR